MTRTVILRVAHALPVLWAAATLVWLFMFIVPGDPARLLAGQRADPEVIQAVKEDWGLDRPPLERYLLYMLRLVRGDLGISYAQQGQAVASILGRAFVRTAFLAVAALLVACIAGVPLGVIAAQRRGAVEAVVTAGSLAGIAVPTFWLGLFLMILFAGKLRWLPVSGYGEGPLLFGVQAPGPAHLVLPALTLAAFPAALIARVTRAALLDQMVADYVLAARARGLSSFTIVWRHAFRNALGPILTIAGLLLATLLGGAVATEIVFSWPGIGNVIYTSLRSRDLPVVEGGVILLTAVFLATNLIVDLAYAIVDPRIRSRES